MPEVNLHHPKNLPKTSTPSKIIEVGLKIYDLMSPILRTPSPRGIFITFPKAKWEIFHKFSIHLPDYLLPSECIHVLLKFSYCLEHSSGGPRLVVLIVALLLDLNVRVRWNISHYLLVGWLLLSTQVEMWSECK